VPFIQSIGDSNERRLVGLNLSSAGARRRFVSTLPVIVDLRAAAGSTQRREGSDDAVQLCECRVLRIVFHNMIAGLAIGVPNSGTEETLVEIRPQLQSECMDDLTPDHLGTAEWQGGI
jgi:hypothetical protein